jgi:hypothetical protein
MWFYGERHSPLSYKYQYYVDNRPITAQDPTMSGWFGLRRLDDPYQKIYLKYQLKNEEKVLFINNIPANEREKLKAYISYYSNENQKNRKALAVFPGLLFMSLVTKYSQCKPWISTGLVVLGFWTGYKCVSAFSDKFTSDYLSYFYNKYSHTAVGKISDVVDKRRQFFRPDTEVYYRETPQQIWDSKNHHEQHDGSIYYGPHPFNDHENVDELIEINKKFMTGKSDKFDSLNEDLLDEKIDIKRRIRDLPTWDDYRKI